MRPSRLRLALRYIRRNKSLAIGLTILIFLILFTVIGFMTINPKHAYPLTDGVKGFMPPQGLLLIAAYMPESWPVRFVDENIRKATAAEIAWADVVVVSGMHVQAPQVHDAGARGAAPGAVGVLHVADQAGQRERDRADEATGLDHCLQLQDAGDAVEQGGHDQGCRGAQPGLGEDGAHVIIPQRWTV